MDQSQNIIPDDNPEPPQVKAEAVVEAAPEPKPETEPIKVIEPVVDGSGEVESSPASTPPAIKPNPARHSWIYRLFNFLLGRDSRLGRVMRIILRWTAAVVGLFALGLLAGYLLLYQPAQKGLDSANLQNGQANTEITQLQGKVAGLQSTLTASNKAVQDAQDLVNRAQARNNLLVVIYDIANARTNLAQKDGAKLINTLDKATTDLVAVQPYLLAVQKSLADELKSRLETVRSVVIRDAQLAQSDLDNLYSALLAADDLIFGAKP